MEGKKQNKKKQQPKKTMLFVSPWTFKSRFAVKSINKFHKKI